MIYCPEIEYPTEEFVLINNGNIISRRAHIKNTKDLVAREGKCFIGPEVSIHSDLATVFLNKYVYLSPSIVLKPCQHHLEGKAIPMVIGSHTYIGENTVIESAVVGLGCDIGKNCHLMSRSILKDFVKVLDDTVIPCDMVIPPFAIVQGNPAHIIGEQPESMATLGFSIAVDRYRALKLA